MSDKVEMMGQRVMPSALRPTEVNAGQSFRPNWDGRGDHAGTIVAEPIIIVMEGKKGQPAVGDPMHSGIFM